jgi:acyl dehydratase
MTSRDFWRSSVGQNEDGYPAVSAIKRDHANGSVINAAGRLLGRHFSMIRYPQVLGHRTMPQRWSFSDRDAILYALCVGFGGEPSHEHALRFLYELNLQVVPTFPTVLAWIADPTFESLGVDPDEALHGEQKIELHRVVSIPLDVDVQGSVVEVYDKGSDRGAILVTRHRITDRVDGELVATLTTTCFARRSGGCGGSDVDAERPHTVPRRAPDHSIDVPTTSDLALLYRLTGDRNPLHADPLAARRAGFERPILHGLCTFGIACRAVLATYADFDPSRIASHQARFAAPVFPGETLTIDLWGDADVISFEIHVRARGVTVVKNGKTVLRPT